MPPTLVVWSGKVIESQEGYLVPWLETWGVVQADHGTPPVFSSPRDPWDLALQGSGASSPCGLHEGEGLQSGRKSQAPSQGGDLGVGGGHG